ncbi:MAG: response regulator [Clostridia bacterium]|nr:response regulator [Clostridia bacterium]
MFSILHLEKSELIKQMVKDSLMSKEVKYIPVDSVDMARPFIFSKKLDLIVTSMIGDLKEIEVFIKEINTGINKDTPIFIVTSNDMDDSVKSILNLGVSDYIHKNSLVTEISKHIDVLFHQNNLLNSLREMSIAVIDDSILDQAVVKDLLSKIGVTQIESYKSGHELFSSGKQYDLYFVDAVLKQEYGKSLIMQIRRNNLNSTIIIISSLNNSKTVAGLLEAGANDFISKPIDENIFIAKLKANMRIKV